MPPRCAVVSRLPSVRQVASRNNGALSNRRYAVGPRRPDLVDTCTRISPKVNRQCSWHIKVAELGLLVPCQCIVVPSSGPSIPLWTFTSILHDLQPVISRVQHYPYQSPQLASINGPGNSPLTSIISTGTPSGARVPRETVQSWYLVTPAIVSRGVPRQH